MLHRRSLLQSAAAVVLTGLPSLAWARSPDDDRRVLEGLLRTHIGPRFRKLADAGVGLIPATEKLAAQSDAATLKAAKDAFARAMDAWGAAQHIRPGPLLLDMRADRIAFWPDKRSVGPRQLAQLLAKQDESLLTADAIARQSAAVQGLTALERLLYDEGPVNGYRARLAAACAGNIARLTAEARDGWATLGPQLLAGDVATPAGKGAGEALTNLYLSLVTACQIVVDQKLLIPLGATAADAKPALAEAVRSGRSLRQIFMNLSAMQGMLLGEDGAPGFSGLVAENQRRAVEDKIADAFGAARRALGGVTDPLDIAVAAPGKRGKVDAAFRAAKGVQNVISRDIPPLLNITLGFNELDGD